MSQSNRLYHSALRGCLIAAFALASAVALAQEPKSPNVAAEPNPAPAQQEAQPEPTPVAPAPKVDAAKDQEPDRYPSYYPREDLDAQRRMAVAAEELVSLTNTQIIIGSIASGLVLVAIGVAFWAGLQARKAAIATGQTAKIADMTAERQLRAYVTTEESTWMKVGDAWCFTHKWQNTGPTPALKTLTHVNWAVFGGEIPDDFDYPDAERDRGNDPAVVGPDQRLLSWPIFIPRGVAEDPSRNVYIWGWADYDDMFTDTARHRTEFCYHVTIDHRAIGEGKVGIGVRVYGRFNGADDDCYRQPEPV